MVGEMGSVARVHKAHAMDPTAVPARRVLRMATIGSAAALHRDQEIGSLEAGKRADLIVVAISGPNAVPMYDPYSHLVYSARSDAVETVVVEGRVLMDRKRIRTLDVEAIRREAGRLGRKIDSALPKS
jgi:cytosine/adenosine deaminase-related metal-dependent hydrolase